MVSAPTFDFGEPLLDVGSCEFSGVDRRAQIVFEVGFGGSNPQALATQQLLDEIVALHEHKIANDTMQCSASWSGHCATRS
jgi:hypothetical protein